MNTMRVGVYVLSAILACCGVVFGQVAPDQTQASTPPDATQSQPNSATAPVTPLQQRDQQVRQVDPLDQGSGESRERVKGDRDAEKQRSRDQTPTPGSIAASEQKTTSQQQGPEVVEDEDAPVQEYSGPAVLSRSYSINRPLIPQQLKWEESLGISSVYDSGISRQVEADGSLGPASTLIGAMANWSLRGRHYFKQDLISVTYSGNYSQYSGIGGYNGLNQSMSVDYEHALSRRLTLNLSGSGSILAQNYSLENQPVGPQTIANINLASSPNIQIYDNGAKQFSSAADVTWQKSIRLSFSGGVSWFGIARDSPALLGVTGEQLRGDMNYRLTRKLTVGSYYSFSHYLYPHGVGNSDTSTFGAIVSYAINRTTQVRFRGGLSLVDSLGEQTVVINPAIAALLGVSTGIIDSTQTYRASDFSAQFVRDFHGGATASVAYARGISPGNGVYQTSQQESISGTMSTRLFRSYSFQAAIGRDTLGSIAQNLGKYKSEYGRIELRRTYRKGIGLNLSAEYRYFDVAQIGYLRNQLRITTGVGWTSGTGRLWPF
ncbi:MAG TPA: hypothetical protein VGL82_05575 [Bryobacteraceae bacterium]